ncbi:hypothetical protein DPMN_140490 [Dreissena polymorpha]|uniref:Uncharacterized protein n=1 Tax=Dreissena polymorpha TaxID=45954 RepID=A0A9D4GB15_DREPO|nr:hypothetical protein DPMN_140490 [Dreissena polymorpha]
MPLRQTLIAFTAATFKIILRRYAELLLRFYYDHEDLSTYDASALPVRLRRFYYALFRLYTDSCWPRSRYACFTHVQNKRGESVEISDHEDSTAIILRL